MGDDPDSAGSPRAESPAPGAEPARCAVCSGPTVLCCSGCEAVFYCSEACQYQDWRQHRKVCSRRGPGQPSYATSVDGGSASATASQASSPRRGGPVSRAGGGVGSPRTAALESVALLGVAQSDELALASASGAGPRSVAELALAPAGGSTPRNMAQAVEIRSRRLQLRTVAVQAARQQRHRDALEAAMEAYQVAQGARGSAVDGDAEAEAATLVEVLLVARHALMTGDAALGLSFLEILTDMTDRLSGVRGGPGALLQPWAAAALLCSASELCQLYGHGQRAEDYARAYLAMVRRAHGEGSPALGDAYGFSAALLAARGKHEEALLSAVPLLRIRHRCSEGGGEAGGDRAVADAHWNVALLQHQLLDSRRGQERQELGREALRHLREARDIHARVSGEGAATAAVDAAAGALHRALGEDKLAVDAFKRAVRARQRAHGFAHPETRRAAEQLASAEAAASEALERQEDAGGDPPGPAPPPPAPSPPSAAPGGGGPRVVAAAAVPPAGARRLSRGGGMVHGGRGAGRGR